MNNRTIGKSIDVPISFIFFSITSKVWHGGEWMSRAKRTRNVTRRCHYRLVRFLHVLDGLGCGSPELAVTPLGRWEPRNLVGICCGNMTVLNCLTYGGLDVEECSRLRSDSCTNPIVVGVHFVGLLPARFKYPCRKVNCPLAQGVCNGRTGKRVTVCIKLTVPAALEI